MPTALLESWRSIRIPVIGMLHLPPLPGSPRYAGDIDAVRRRLLDDAGALVSGGVNGLMMENFGDAPFFPSAVPVHVVSHMTSLAVEVRRAHPHVPLGINVLRNDGVAALAVAHAVGASFIRVNILCGARVTDQGVIQGIAHDLLRLRQNLGAGHIRILADVDVKHSAPLAQRAIEDEVADTVERGLADALVVSGSGTGKPVDADQLQRVKRAAGDCPVFLGSGVSTGTIGAYLPHIDGVIVGTSIKRDGKAEQPVDAQRVRALMQRVTPL
ncbi:MAG: BtpA/SgcQ family protein [Phycisphaeraceae bacterium]